MSAPNPIEDFREYALIQQGLFSPELPILDAVHIEEDLSAKAMRHIPGSAVVACIGSDIHELVPGSNFQFPPLWPETLTQRFDGFAFQRLEPLRGDAIVGNFHGVALASAESLQDRQRSTRVVAGFIVHHEDDTEHQIPRHTFCPIESTTIRHIGEAPVQQLGKETLNAINHSLEGGFVDFPALNELFRRIPESDVPAFLDYINQIPIGERVSKVFFGEGAGWSRSAPTLRNMYARTIGYEVEQGHTLRRSTVNEHSERRLIIDLKHVAISCRSIVAHDRAS